jgi:hypothetical protein
MSVRFRAARTARGVWVAVATGAGAGAGEVTPTTFALVMVTTGEVVTGDEAVGFELGLEGGAGAPGGVGGG